MKYLVCASLMFILLFGGMGCQKKKPDPREQPGFKDTSDPSTILQLPQDPRQMKGEEIRS